MNLNARNYMRSMLICLFKIVAILLFLYLFVCSLTFLSTSFRILGGQNLSSLFSSSEVLSNPIVGVMLGILMTVLVQSSATSTSIIVSLVSAGVEVQHAIPMIFGSNIGTSVTNTIVSMTQAGDRETFRRAFSAATVHDMFNVLSVFALTFLEVTTHLLEIMTEKLVDVMPLDGNYNNNASYSVSNSPDFLKAITKPFTNIIVQVDRQVLLGWSFKLSQYENVTSLIKNGCRDSESNQLEPCPFLLSYLGEHGLGLGDTWLGLILLAFSLALLCCCLISMMKILNSILGSHMATIIQKTINADIPYVPWLTGYIGILIGAVITILVRSSSVFTSTLTPLCGSGLVSLETAYPMTLGSNIGTTTTSILASFAAEGKYLKPSVQIAMVHLFFNIIGISLFYPVPFMRWPIPLAKKLGDVTSKYRWFAIFYLVFMFFLIPGLVFLLSLAGNLALYLVITPIAIFVFIICVVNVLQNRFPRWLPPILRNWKFLPFWMRSLKPLDDLFKRISICHRCARDDGDGEEPDAPADACDVGGNKSNIIKKVQPMRENKNSTELESLIVEPVKKEESDLKL